MAKKKTNRNTLKKLLNEFIEKSLLIIISSFKKISISKWVSNLVHLKKRIRKYLFAVVLLAAGIILLSIGISSYLVYIYPSLEHGLIEMIIGTLLIIISIIIYKVRR